MVLVKKSSFKSDLKKEQKLAVLLDVYYKTHLKHYNFERIHALKEQLLGVDIVFTHKQTGNTFFIDEKAQLDYINNDLPTFAFELSYQKNGTPKEGWLFDESKKTDFYALVTAIYSDELEKYTSCKITFVNRKKLICLLMSKNIDQKVLAGYIKKRISSQAKMPINQLNIRKEGYLYFSTANKAEKPLNLILKLDFLIANGVAKRFI